MLEIYRIKLLKEIKLVNFVALEADETTDTSNQQKMVIITRYVIDGQVYERFWAFIKPAGYSADDLSKTLLAKLDVILSSPSEKSKLIAQSYDGAAVMSGKNNGVQAILKKKFPNDPFIHCYAH